MSNPLLGTWSFNDVLLNIAGVGGNVSVGANSGADEGGITVTMTDNKNTMRIGADGTGVHVLNAGNSGVIEVRLSKLSPANKLLGLMYNAQLLDSTVWGKNVLMLTQKTSGDQVQAIGAAFQKLPDRTDARDPGMNSWRFDCISIQQYFGDYS